MIDKETKILDAAVATFSRYGARRATMTDIANAAEVSRQTLYAKYANKDDIIAAAIQHQCQMSLAEIQAAWTEHESLSAKLDAYFEIAVVTIFDRLRREPDFADLLSGTNSKGNGAARKAEEMRREALIEMVLPHHAAIQKSGQTPEQFAEFVQVASGNLIHSSADRDTLQEMLEALKISILAVLEQ